MICKTLQSVGVFGGVVFATYRFKPIKEIFPYQQMPAKGMNDISRTLEQILATEKPEVVAQAKAKSAARFRSLNITSATHI